MMARNSMDRYKTHKRQPGHIEKDENAGNQNIVGKGVIIMAT